MTENVSSKCLLVEQVLDILPVTGEEIVDAYDIRALGEQLLEDASREIQTRHR